MQALYIVLLVVFCCCFLFQSTLVKIFEAKINPHIHVYVHMNILRKVKMFEYSFISLNRCKDAADLGIELQQNQ